MSNHENLSTYIQDHLAGARFAVNLLEDLSKNSPRRIATMANRLLPEIEQDRAVLERILDRLERRISYSKEFVAWFAQKAGRIKLSLSTAFGQFEAVETLSLGVLGKLALWRTLQTIEPTPAWLTEVDLSGLIQRARAQHRQLERLRLQLAKAAFGR
ncbi:MAG: hypothetical protein SGJ19_02535 [Planctomycetia bacterium]|nr:hypothetical protein [Planctomycetia bacterium]